MTWQQEVAALSNVQRYSETRRTVAADGPSTTTCATRSEDAQAGGALATIPRLAQLDTQRVADGEARLD